MVSGLWFRTSRFSSRFATILLLAASPSLAQQNRLPERVDATRRVALRGTTTPRAELPLDRGPVEPDARLRSLSLLLNRTPEQQTALDRLLAEQQDPVSPNYHRWLTPEEFADRFSLSQSDFDRVTGWLKSAGFSVDYAGRGRNWILFSGTAAQVESAFQTRMRRYLVDGKLRYANASEASAPEAIAPLVSWLRLNDVPMTAPKPRPLITAGDGDHALVPGDLATIYNVNPLYQTGIDGTGQKIAVIGSSNIHMDDMRQFRTAFGLPQNDPHVILVDGSADPGYNDAEGEADLDLQYSGGIAPKATLLYVNSTVFIDSAVYAVDQNLAPIISMSFGICAAMVSSTPVQLADAYRAEAQQANAQGITWLVSSGDSGAAGCDYGGPKQATKGLDVNVFAAAPEVTAVGGTTFNEGSGNYWSNNNNSTTKASALSYIPETSWNDTASLGAIWSTGGGASVYYSKPSWQTGPGVPNDNARDLPDLSLTASGDHDGYLVITQGNVSPIGGTSASTPTFAAMVALLNQYLLSTGKISQPGLSNINPNLYRLAQVSPGVFHDVTSGSNIVPCKVGTKDCTSGQFGYRAGVGYDLVTGWGSVDAYKLITGWNSNSVTSTTTTVSASPSSIAVTASTTVTATVKALSGTQSPGGSVTFTAGSTSLGTASLSGSGGTSTATLTVNGSQLAIGANTITASYGGASGFASSNGTASVTVTAATGGATTTAVTANPTSISPAASSVLTATVKAATGAQSPTGSVAFVVGNSTLGTANLSGSGGSATASFTVNGSQLAVGANTISAVYAGAGGFGGSVGTVTVTVSVASTSTSTQVSAHPASIASSGNTVITAVVSAASGTATPAGAVTFTMGSTSLGAAALSGSGGASSASITVGGSRLASGNNTITASYAGGSGFGASSGTVVVTVSVGGGATVNTTTSLSATPTSITTNTTTVLKATVAASGNPTQPAGQVSFVWGNITLGSATLSGGTATLTIAGSRLAVGVNTVTAFYGGGAGFNESSGATPVTVTLPTSGSAIIPSVFPNPVYQQEPDDEGYSFFFTLRLSEIAGTGTSLKTFTFRTTDGSIKDYSSSISSFFGSSSVTSRGTLVAYLRATVAIVPSSWVFTFTGTDANGAAWTQQLEVPFLPQQISASMQVNSSPGTVVQNPNGNPECDAPYQFYHQQLNLQEKNGYEVVLTKFLAGGNDLSDNIPDWFGSWRLAPLGTLRAGICWSISNSPKTLNYEIDGVDSEGNKIATTANIPFNPAPALPAGPLSSSVKSVALNVAPTQSANATVGVNISAGVQWSASLFPANQKSSWLVIYPQSGAGPGTVNLVASAAGLPNGVYTATLVLQSVNTIPQFVNVPVTLTVGSAGSVKIDHVSSAASFKEAFAPGMLVGVYGTNLASSTVIAGSVPLPYVLQKTSASINGVPAPLWFVSQGQINLQIPYEIPTRGAVLAVNNNGQVATFTLPSSVSPASPGIFQANGSLVPFASAARGQGILLFITGDGDVLPYVASGVPPAGDDYTKWPKPRLDLTLSVGGVPVTPSYVGIPNWSVGVTQINFTVPSNLPSGPQAVVVTVGGVQSPPVNLNITAAAANVQIGFSPATVKQSSGGSWNYTTTLQETASVGVTLTKLVVFGNDYTGQITNWFGSTRLAPSGTLSGGFSATCSCSPPWDGVWQVTGRDDNGNTNTWTGTVHFVSATGSAPVPESTRPLTRVPPRAVDDIAPVRMSPEAVEAQRTPAWGPMFDLVTRTGGFPVDPPLGAANAKAER